MGEFSRRCHRFAIVYAAGALAVDAGILPFGRDEVLRACATCLEAALEERDDGQTFDDEAILDEVRRHLQLKEANFRNVDGPDASKTIFDQLGFIDKGHGKPTVYYVESSVFKSHFCGSYSIRPVAETLARHNHLLVDSEGKRSVLRRFGDSTSRRYYAITESIFS